MKRSWPLVALAGAQVIRVLDQRLTAELRLSRLWM
jgi:hypothetical protein